MAWHLGTQVATVSRHDGRLAVALADGTSLVVDVVLSAIGLRPRLDLTQAAGLVTHRDIAVDALLTTNDPAISALGDCAEIEGVVRSFILPLQHSARALAATLTGTATAVAFPIMPVVVKTPAYPLVILRPEAAGGAWDVEAVHAGLIARCRDADGVVRGVVLGGEAVNQRETVLAEVGLSALAAAG